VREPNIDLLFSCCMHEKDVAGSRCRVLSGGLGANPPEAETFLVFGRAMEAAHLLIFNIWKRKKSEIYVLSCKNDV